MRRWRGAYNALDKVEEENGAHSLSVVGVEAHDMRRGARAEVCVHRHFASNVGHLVRIAAVANHLAREPLLESGALGEVHGPEPALSDLAEELDRVGAVAVVKLQRSDRRRQRRTATARWWQCCSGVRKGTFRSIDRGIDGGMDGGLDVGLTRFIVRILG